MKQGLSVRVSQHLALTPQLQQSIRLLQLSTLELSQEVEQMLDDNPFLELSMDEAPREEFGLEQADSTVRQDDRDAEASLYSGADAPASTTATDNTGDSTDAASTADEPSWDGDGTTEMVPDDGEWGADAAPRKNNLDGSDERDATELARNQESLTAFLHRQALALRLSEVDRAALRFLIESLNDDGYLEDSLRALAESLAGGDIDEVDELEHRFSVALHLLQHLEPVGVGARTLAECLQLQLQHLRTHAPDLHDPEVLETAASICAQPMELLARRDIKRLVQITGQCFFGDLPMPPNWPATRSR